jgi:pyruvate kinase
MRPESCVLVGLSAHVPTLRRLALVWGVQPVVLPDYSTTEEMIRQAAVATRRAGLTQSGDLVAVVSGPVHAGPGGTDRLALFRVP